MATDDVALLRTSEANPAFRVERLPDGTVTMSRASTNTGRKSLKAARQLDEYADEAGGAAFDSSTGFAIGPDAEVRSPDAAWMSDARIAELPPERREGFWPLCPDVVIEIRSQGDRFGQTIAAVDRFMARGSVYGVAIDPQTREVVERGMPPSGLVLRFDAIIDA